MPQYQPSMIARDDTFLGVCQAIGDDFRFHPNWLRVGFALALFWNPVGAACAYVALGGVVALSRLLVREPRVELPEPVLLTDEGESETTEQQRALPLAA